MYWSAYWAGAAKHQLSSTDCPGDMELRLKMKREGEDGWLRLSGAEEQSAEKIEANAARHQVFPDVQVLPVAFLFRRMDLRGTIPITCFTVHP